MADPANDLTPMPREGLIPDPNASETEQILGTTAMPDRTRDNIDPRWRRYYDQLIEQRDALIDAQTDLDSKAREISPNVVQDEPAEIGTEEFQRDQLLGVRTFDQETLTEVNAAISRIEAGTYGVCELTGEAISEERLTALPWARFTIEAQQEMESRGQTAMQAIGPRGNMAERGAAPAGPWRAHDGSM